MGGVSTVTRPGRSPRRGGGNRHRAQQTHLRTGNPRREAGRSWCSYTGRDNPHKGGVWEVCMAVIHYYAGQSPLEAGWHVSTATDVANNRTIPANGRGKPPAGHVSRGIPTEAGQAFRKCRRVSSVGVDPRKGAGELRGQTRPAGRHGAIPAEAREDVDQGFVQEGEGTIPAQTGD